MNDLDLMEIERRARKMRSVEIRRLLHSVAHALVECARYFVRSLHLNTKSHA